MRRDGSIPEWPYFVMGARDPAAPAALRAYAVEADRIGMDPQYCIDVNNLAGEFEQYRAEHGDSDPDAAPHREDNEQIITMMEQGKGS